MIPFRRLNSQYTECCTLYELPDLDRSGLILVSTRTSHIWPMVFAVGFLDVSRSGAILGIYA